MAVNLASLKSPGVYVQEVPSQVKAITGVSTSTAGFIGVLSQPPQKTLTVVNENVGTGDGTTTEFKLQKYPVIKIRV
jgi:uncharacterized protein